MSHDKAWEEFKRTIIDRVDRIPYNTATEGHMSFKSTKTYDHNEGLSCVFRQWKADGTHCKFLHGYALRFRITFGCTELDERNWVQNFGGLKPLKEWLHHMFDHTIVVAADDPELEALKALDSVYHIAQVRVIPSVGCEQVALHVFNWIDNWLKDQPENFRPRSSDCSLREWNKYRVRVEAVEVSEHTNNSAIYERKPQ